MSVVIANNVAHSVPGKIAELTDLAAVVDALVEAREHAKLYDQLCDDLEAAVKARMGDAEIGTIDGEPVVSFKSTVRQSVSHKELKANYPLVALACVCTSTVRTFRLLHA